MIEIKRNNDEEFNKVIKTNLHTFNRSKCKWIRENTETVPSKRTYSNFGVYENNVLVGGAVGVIRFGWYFLDDLWLDEKCRNKDIGTEIIKQIECYAKEKKALGIRTETWDFQAKVFYEKQGFHIYATFEDCPPSTIEYFLKKKF